MNEIYFEGHGYLKIDTDSFEDAEQKLNDVFADAGIDLEYDVLELRDENGNEIG